MRTGGSGEGTERSAWIVSRHRALVLVLTGEGMDAAVAWRVATAVLAQWGLETGWGRSEWNYDLGNIRALGWWGLFHILTDGYDYRAYRSLDEGVRAQLSLLRAQRYAAAWQRLVAGGSADAWYSDLMHAGWNPWSEATLQTYRGCYTRVANTVGGVPADIGAYLGGEVSVAGWLLGAAALIAVGVGTAAVVRHCHAVKAHVRRLLA
ncbi:MAG: glucosaminidase domain-containing protein [Myxococcales bacterium]|nr:glucosaminidase domain-containing protein [Myxococcales bacterium]